MPEPEHTPLAAAPPARSLSGELGAALREDQRRRWLQGERVLVESYLARHPGLSDQTETLLDLIYNEIVIREECGDPPCLGEYLTRFPQLAGDLRVRFEVHRAIAVADGQATFVDSTPPGERAAELPVVVGYEVLRELGRGGMGVVYLARQLALKRLVALKMVLAGDCAGEAEVARFRTEAEAVARLQHPNIVQVYEIGEHHGRPYLSLEYAAQGSLDQRARANFTEKQLTGNLSAQPKEQVHELKLSAGRTYAFDLTSATLNPVLRLEDHHGHKLDEKAVEPEIHRPARIIFTPPKDETYRLFVSHASSPQPGTGAYRITSRMFAAPK
jgi:hypothetical protein